VKIQDSVDASYLVVRERKLDLAVKATKSREQLPAPKKRDDL
jgi:hypothetical protein